MTPRDSTSPRPSGQAPASQIGEAQGERTASARLCRLRSTRVRPERGRTLAPELQSFVKSLKRMSAGCARASEAWDAAAPDRVRDGTRVTDLRASVLMVEARSASDRHLADRWLRGGGLDEVRSIARAPISRVRFSLAGSKPRVS